MADVNIDPFGDHNKTESRPDEPTGENIPLTPVGGGSTWEPECEQETSFRGEESLGNKLLKVDVERLYQKLSKKYQLPKERHTHMFKIVNGELYYIGLEKPLTYDKGRLRLVGAIENILHKGRLEALGLFKFKGKVTDQETVILNRVEEDMPSASDITKADDIELQEITENATKSTDDLIAQFKGQEMLPMHELLGLDKQLRSIKGLLKVEVA